MHPVEQLSFFFVFWVLVVHLTSWQGNMLFLIKEKLFELSSQYEHFGVGSETCGVFVVVTFSVFK